MKADISMVRNKGVLVVGIGVPLFSAVVFFFFFGVVFLWG